LFGLFDVSKNEEVLGTCFLMAVRDCQAMPEWLCGQHQLLNLDYWYLCEGPFKREEAPPAMK